MNFKELKKIINIEDVCCVTFDGNIKYDLKELINKDFFDDYNVNWIKPINDLNHINDNKITVAAKFFIYLKEKEEGEKMKIFFAASNPPHITEKDTGILRRVCFIPNEECWKTGNYTDGCDCNLCPHKDECSGYDKEEE